MKTCTDKNVVSHRVCDKEAVAHWKPTCWAVKGATERFLCHYHHQSEEIYSGRGDYNIEYLPTRAGLRAKLTDDLVEAVAGAIETATEKDWFHTMEDLNVRNLVHDSLEEYEKVYPLEEEEEED